MLGGLRRLFYAVIVAAALLWSPATAFACSGGPSAVNVYKECVPTGSGSKPTSGGGKSSGHTSSTGSTQPAASTQPAVSNKAAKALKHTGKQERRRLAALLNAYGTNRLPEPSSSSAGASEPSALGSAFDLGSGPTVLLIVLAGTAVLLLAGSGMRIRRHRHRA